MKNLALLVGLLVFVNVCYGQIKGLSSFDVEDMFKGDAIEQMNSEQILKETAIPLGNIVDAGNYHIGPGDIILIQNISSLSQKEVCIVTPENKLIVPRIGEVDLSGKTLAEARDLIIEKIKGNTKDALVFVSLYKPRSIIVEVSGNVTFPGTYTYPASFKISTILKYADQKKSNNMTSMQQSLLLFDKSEKSKQYDKLFANSGMPYISSYSNRNILVFHNDGTSEIADIEKAQALNDSKFDPYIRESDKIYVPFNNEVYQIITIAGSVIRPFVTTFKKGDMASMLLKFGGGLRDDADINNVKLLLPETNKNLTLSIDDKLNLIGDNVELEPGSIITVGSLTNDTKLESGVVSVVGQVKKQGVYPIIPDKTTIKEVIDMAGGFTEDAYLQLASVIRRDESLTDSRSLPYQLMEKFQYSNLTPYDTSRYQIDMKMRQPLVSCDFIAAFDNNISSANITLKDGDIIKIPNNPKTVFVFGQVKNPGYVAFENNKNMEWYIQKAGGYAESSEKDKARIIRGRNKIWVEGEDEVYVFAGDEIYVPAPSNVPAEIKSQTWAMIAAAVGALASLINVIWFISRSN